MSSTLKLSILAPVFNEEKTIREIALKISEIPLEHFNIKKEVIFVDDGSTDRSSLYLQEIAAIYPCMQVLSHSRNKGKGAAVKTALGKAKGDIVIVQDCDLEYNPQDIIHCVLPIAEGKAQVVYGSRFLHPELVIRYRRHWLATKILNWTVFLLYFRSLTDETTCYKTFDAKVLKSFVINADGFDWNRKSRQKS